MCLSKIKDKKLKKKLTNKNRQLKCRYGITLNQYNEMLRNQKGKCKLCKKIKRLVVEHNHENGKVRGLTCDRCNQLLGHLEHIDYDLIDRVHCYLNTDGKYTDYRGVDYDKISN
jgi:hypothetical protein